MVIIDHQGLRLWMRSHPDFQCFHYMPTLIIRYHWNPHSFRPPASHTSFI